MLSNLPNGMDNLPKDKIDNEILRAGIIAELDAINFYEQMAGKAQDENIKKILLDIAREEKTHVGEFQRLLLNRDKEQVKENKEAEEEIKEEVGE